MGHTIKKRIMNHYEILCVLPGTLSEDEVTGVANKVFAVFEKEGAQNALVEDMGKSRLAYPVKHIRYGYFRLFRLEAEGTTINAIQEKLRLIPELLRAVVHVYDPAKVSDKKINYVAGGTISSISREKVSPKERREGKRENQRTDDFRSEEEKTPVEAPVAKAEVKEEAPIVEKTEVKEKAVEVKNDLNLDEINKKLDNILSEDISDV